MKAIVWTKYGPPELLEYRDVEIPKPKDNEVLLKVVASTVTAGDCEMRGFYFAHWIRLPLRLYMGIFKPRRQRLGQEVSGIIEEVGEKIQGFKKGDAVFSSTGMSLGAYAEYVAYPVRAVAKKPAGITFEQAATIPTGGINGLHFLRKAEVKEGDKLLINGAGGSIGTYALQLAKSMGAEVTCVDSAIKLDMLLENGADHVIDYQKEDFTKNGKTYDVIIDVVGSCSFSNGLKSLNKNGRFVMGNPTFMGMIRAMINDIPGFRSGKKVLFEFAAESNENLSYLAGLLEVGKLKAIIDKRYPLEEVPEAHKYVEAGSKIGNVIISVRPEMDNTAGYPNAIT
jgi:NADPH:quinone reductase-like Zn-dependent oxidoreductase